MCPPSLAGEHGFALSQEWTHRAIKFLTNAGFGWVDGEDEWEGCSDCCDDNVRALAPSPLTLPEKAESGEIALVPVHA